MSSFFIDKKINYKKAQLNIRLCGLRHTIWSQSANPLVAVPSTNCKQPTEGDTFNQKTSGKTVLRRLNAKFRSGRGLI